MTVLRLMIDLSSNNAAPDLDAHYRAGYRVLALKASEGTSYRWTAGGDLADRWHKLGGAVVWYHFATAAAGGKEQAAFFLAGVKPHLRAGDTLTLDIEGQPASYRQWAHEQAHLAASSFMAHIDAHAPRLGVLRRRPKRLVYGTFYFLRDEHIRPAKGWRLWIAGYQASAPLPPPGWKRWTAWQFTDNATHVPGEAGGVDESHIRDWLLPVTHRTRVRRRALRPGDRGAHVEELQKLLNARKVAKLTVDGVYGEDTAAAVNAVKRAHRWQPNGVAGRRVIKALRG